MVRRFLAADALSLFGNAAAAVVLPWLVLVRTQDVGAAGTVAAVSALPMLLAAVGGGVLVDRLGRRRTSVLADLGSAASVAALPIVDATVGLDLGWFIALAIAGALFDVPGMTAREALLPDVAAAAGVPVERVAGLREAAAGTVLLLGPAAGAALLAILGGSGALWLTAAASAAAAAITATLRVPDTAAPADAARGPRAWLADLVVGWTVLRGDRVLAVLTGLTTAAVAVLGPLLWLVLPAHLAGTASPGWLGAVIAGLAVGGLAGSSLYAVLATRLTRRGWFVAGVVVQGAGLVLISLLPAPWLLVAGAVLAGLGGGPLSPLLTVVIAERVPAQARGRVLGLQNAAVLAAMPVGLYLAGLAADEFGVLPVGRLVAVAWGAVTLAALAAPSLRRLEVVGAHDR